MQSTSRVQSVRSKYLATNCSGTHGEAVQADRQARDVGGIWVQVADGNAKSWRCSWQGACQIRVTGGMAVLHTVTQNLEAAGSLLEPHGL